MDTKRDRFDEKAYEIWSSCHDPYSFMNKVAAWGRSIAAESEVRVRELTKENSELKEALSGRTVSCSECNRMGAKLSNQSKVIDGARKKLISWREIGMSHYTDLCELIEALASKGKGGGV